MSSVDRALTRSQFTGLVQDLGYPAMQLGHRVIRGAAWRDVVTRAAVSERRAFIQRLRYRLLVATPYGRERLRRWLDDEKPLPAMPSTELRAFITEYVLFYGDPSISAVVVDGLERAPEPVRQATMNSCAFLGVGRDSVAWIGGAGFVDREGRHRARVIVVGPDADFSTVLHECGHAWHAPIAEQSLAGHQAVTLAGEIGIRQFAQAQGFKDQLDQFKQRDERLADACATCWLDRRANVR